jgi:hypothetical protein
LEYTRYISRCDKKREEKKREYVKENERQGKEK